MPTTAQNAAPRAAAVLFLGDHSAYGLSVARRLLESRFFEIRRVVTPSASVYDRFAARGAPRRGLLAHGLRAALERARAKIHRTLAAAGPAPGGEPLTPLVLDPGTSAEALAAACADCGVRWERVDAIGTQDFRALLRDVGLDLFFCCAFPLIFRANLLALPSRGAVNFHPSLLPRCRGRHPIFWTLASGEPQGGVSAHFMTPEVDAGDIVAQIPLPLTEIDDYGALYRRAMDASAELVRLVETFFREPGSRGVPQDSARATYFHEDSDEDHHVKWDRMSPRAVAALARTGAAYTVLRGARLGVLEAKPVGEASAKPERPGRIVALSGEDLVVSASGGLVAVAAAGWFGRRHDAGELARKLGLRPGENLR